MSARFASRMLGKSSKVGSLAAFPIFLFEGVVAMSQSSIFPRRRYVCAANAACITFALIVLVSLAAPTTAAAEWALTSFP